MTRHFEDFSVGQRFPLGPRVITAEEIRAFAREWDPQTFHLDEAAAKASILGGLCASGWQTTALHFRLMADAFVLDTASLGSNGIEEARWLKPVYAGETLTGETEITGLRRSSKNPSVGVVSYGSALRANGIEKCTMSGVFFVRART